jgi:predicted  nucleic acid-binding Zn-ribbon protein
MSNKMFPVGIDPLNDLMLIKQQLSEVTDAVILLQTNQNELIRAVSEQQQTQNNMKQSWQAMMQHIRRQDAEIKELRNSIAQRTDTP